MSQKLVIFGLTTMARMAHFYFGHDSDYEIVAFTADREHIKEDRFLELPVVPFEEVERHYPPGEYDLFVAMGYRKLNRHRREKYEAAKEKGYTLPSYLCSRASSWGDTKIGDNCFILENQVLQPFITIGNNTFIWSGCHFGHDVSIGSHCFFSSHVVVCGGVKIGDNCFIGGNAFLRDGIEIADDCVVGAQTVILRSTEPKQVFVAQATDPYRLDSERFMRFMDISM